MEELRKEIDEWKKNNPVADAKRAVDEAVAPVEKEFRDEAREIDKAVREQTSEKSSAPSSASDKAASNPSANEAAKS